MGATGFTRGRNKKGDGMKILRGFVFTAALLSVVNFLGVGGGVIVGVLFYVFHLDKETAVHLGFGIGLGVFVVTAMCATFGGICLSALSPDLENEYYKSDPWLGLSSGG